jgi:hypothetical protein
MKIFVTAADHLPSRSRGSHTGHPVSAHWFHARHSGGHIRRWLSRRMCPGVTARRVVAGLPAAIGLFVGAWAAAAPRSFFTSFPLAGHPWIAPLPAYNEHLTRDVGDLYLALFAISLWAVLRPRPETFRLVGTAWLVFSVPHLVFHAAHLGLFSTPDAVGNVVTLGGAVVLAVLLMWPQPLRSGTSRRG